MIAKMLAFLSSTLNKEKKTVSGLGLPYPKNMVDFTLDGGKKKCIIQFHLSALGM